MISEYTIYLPVLIMDIPGGEKNEKSIFDSYFWGISFIAIWM